MFWCGTATPKPDEVSDPTLFEFMSKMKKEGKIRLVIFRHSRMASLLTEAAKSIFTMSLWSP